MNLRLKLLLPQLLVFFVCFAGFVFYVVMDQTNRKELSLAQKMEMMTKLTATTNEAYLWNMDTTGMGLGLDSLIEDPEIVSVEIQDATGNLVLSRTQKDPPTGLPSRSADIKHESDKIGTVILTFTDVPIKKEVGLIALQISAMGVIIFLLIGGVIVAVANVIIRPLLAMVKVVHDMSEGEGDLTVRITSTGRDEIGKLAGHLNVFLDKLLLIVQKTKQVATTSAEFGGKLVANTAEASSSATQIAATMESMNQRTTLLNDEIAKSSHSFEAVNTIIARVAQMISEQAAAVNESSASVEQMISNAATIERTTDEKMKFAQQLVAAGKRSEESAIRNVEGMEVISLSTEAISDMITVINNVASQTDLLAMNAAIEAAHAGEYGKGFSVVADEIRKLAEQTSNNAQNISVSLKEMILGIQNATIATRESSSFFTEIISGIGEVYNSMSETMSGLKEMAIGNQQITESLTALIKVTQDLRSSGENMDESTKAIQLSFQRIAEVSGENARGTEEISVGMTAISNAIIELNQLSTENSNNTLILEEQMAKFKV